MQEPDNGQLTVAQAEDLTDSQRLNYLRKQWGMRELRVQGHLIRAKDLWWLADVKSEDGTRLRYPLADFNPYLGFERPGVFLGNDNSLATDLREPNTTVSAILYLARPDERNRQHNPLLVTADPESIKRLTRILPERIFHNEDGSIAIAETVRQEYIEKCREEVNADLYELEEKKVALTRESAGLAAEVDALSQRQRVEQEALQEATARRLEAQQELEAITQELAELRRQRDRELGEIHTKADALRAYVKARIEPLHRLELISDAQWKALFPSQGQADQSAQADWPVFDDDTSRTIDHIQRYLFKQDIVYPWELLANFHALLGTGDLIILSGLSGAGKTNLVKSYAKATGNEYRIIPVKPNWTSAEDLLGFHNPLQHAYATTPFIEALFSAQRDPERLYLICLDEMNLARVEYYFADFLSRLEDRKDPTIDLYPDDEAGQVLTELRVLMLTVEGLSIDMNAADLKSVLADCTTMAGIAKRLGLGDGDSFTQLHARIRRMLAGALTVPPRMSIPPNVRFIGAVNMDDTAHYLSPKVLDRAHVLQFQSPLDYWQQVAQAFESSDLPTTGIKVPAAAFPERREYPRYQQDDPLVATLTGYWREFLAPLGIEFGMRPLRQALLYRDRLGEVFEGDGLHLLALNNLLRQKVLPRFSFDGKQRAPGRGELTRDAIVRAFRDRLVEDMPALDGREVSSVIRASDELNAMIERAAGNDGVYNYWA